MFREGVLPDWEDQENREGGRWIVRRQRGEVDAAWLELLFFLIGEHAEDHAGEITGVVVNVRKKGDKVAVWLRDARSLGAVVDVGRQLRTKLGLGQEARVQFSVHREERQKEGRVGLPVILL